MLVGDPASQWSPDHGLITLLVGPTDNGVVLYPGGCSLGQRKPSTSVPGRFVVVDELSIFFADHSVPLGLFSASLLTAADHSTLSFPLNLRGAVFFCLPSCRQGPVVLFPSLHHAFRLFLF